MSCVSARMCDTKVNTSSEFVNSAVHMAYQHILPYSVFNRQIIQPKDWHF